MKKNGFAPILIILVIAIIAVIGYLGYKNIIKPSNSPSSTSQTEQKELIEYVRTKLTANCLKIVNDPGYLKSCDNLVPDSVSNCKKQREQDRLDPESACDRSTYDITVESIERNYALGAAGSPDGPGFYWAAAKTDGQWSYMMTGNAAPDCKDAEIFPLGTFNGKFDSCFKDGMGELIERK